jgi:hypothetical protein
MCSRHADDAQGWCLMSSLRITVDRRLRWTGSRNVPVWVVRQCNRHGHIRNQWVCKSRKHAEQVADVLAWKGEGDLEL